MNHLVRRIVGVVTAVALGGGTSACMSAEGNGSVDAALQSPFAPVVIKVLNCGRKA